MDKNKLYVFLISVLLVLTVVASFAALHFSSNLSESESENKELNSNVNQLENRINTMSNNLTDLKENNSDISEDKEQLEEDVGHFRDSAILDAEATGWAKDANEIVYTYSVANYGDSQAEDVAVSCGVYDENDDLISSETTDAGNIASNSYDVFQDESSDMESNSMDDTMSCSVAYCEDCVKLEHNLDVDYVQELLEEEGYWSPIDQLTA